MPLYAATVIGPQGRRFAVTEDAHDAASLREALRQRNLWPLQIVVAQPPPGFRRTKLSSRDFIALLHQLELQLNAGVTADVALAQIAADAPKGDTRLMLAHIHREVAAGRPIHEACRFFERQFPPHVAAVIAAGEASAQLPVALRSLAEHLAGAAELRRTARRALIYPAVVFTATTALILFLLGGVVPQFAAIFSTLHLDLPALTRAMIAASGALRRGWPLLAGGVLAAGGVAWFLRGARRFRLTRDALILRVPVWGEVIRCVATARFAAHARLLVDAGIPLLDALTAGADLTGNELLTRQIHAARDGVAVGRPLHASLPASHAFPAFFIAALKSGETSGQLGAALRHIETYASAQGRDRLATALALLEPVLLATLTAVVGVIALSFFLPLFALLGGVSAH